MTNELTRYTATLTVDAEGKVIVGRSLDVDDIVVFYGECVAEFEARLHAAVDAYVATLRRLARQAS